ncbi:hypothetical protein [Streptomyces aureocirculatus]|uniref:hypothetical protein n=1 Tax=Streptomyces aureocirculatus TaxID=67275 RepID=UPI0004CACDC2|nr:hypothetical protein [Streptomyces aureocirculatus]
MYAACRDDDGIEYTERVPDTEPPFPPSMLANVPLNDEERAAVDDGQAALDQLLERLVDVPTPAGATPRQTAVPATATLLPIVAVNQGKG